MKVLSVLVPVMSVLHLLIAQDLATKDIKRIYVDGIGQRSSLEAAKKDLVSELRKLKSIEVVDSPDKANAILTGDGDIYVKGYYSLNPRSGLSVANGHPIYGGYLSIELRDASGVTLWSYLANASDSKDAARQLSKDIVKHLAAILPKTS